MLPKVIAACPSSFQLALKSSSPWAVELLTGPWGESELDLDSFYEAFFEPFQAEADEVRKAQSSPTPNEITLAKRSLTTCVAAV